MNMKTKKITLKIIHIVFLYGINSIWLFLWFEYNKSLIQSSFQIMTRASVFLSDCTVPRGNSDLFEPFFSPFYFLISKIVKLQLNKYSKPRYSKLCCIVFKMHELSCPKMNLWKWCNLFVGHFKGVWSEKSLVTDLSPSGLLKQTML